MPLTAADLVTGLFRRFTKKTAPTRPKANRFRPMLECYEERTVPSTVTVAALADAHEGGGSGSFRFTRDGDVSQSAMVYVTYSAGATATPGADYTALLSYVTFAPGSPTADVTVSPVNDSTSEPTETVVATIINGANYTIGSPSSATVNLYDNDAQVVSVAKIADATEGGTAGTFRFTRTGDLSGSLTANFSVGGTATSGTDYTSIGTTVTFAPDSATADVTVAAQDDVTYDPGETVIATVTSGTGYSVGSPSSATVTITDDEGVQVYWVGGNGGSWSTAANWSNNAVPTSTTAVYFDGAQSNYGVTTPASPGGITLRELHFVNGYSGTLTLASNLSVTDLELASADATLDQPSTADGSNLTVTRAMLWVAGTLNSTVNLSDVTITGSGTWARFAPASGGTVNLGSSINLSSGAVATMKEGTIEVTNDGMELNINADCGMLVDPGTGNVATVNVQILGVAQININTNAWLQVISGQFGNVDAHMPLKNNGGSFILESGTWALFGGSVDTDDEASFLQTAGATYIAADATLAAGLLPAKFTGGLLSIKCGAKPEGFQGNIVNDLIIAGADVAFDPGTGSRRAWGTLLVDGDVTWSAGTYHPYVDAEANWNGDLWKATGTFAISGSAAIAPTAIDAEGLEATPASNMEWELFASTTSITAASPAPSLTTGWTYTQENATPVKWWHLGST